MKNHRSFLAVTIITLLCSCAKIAQPEFRRVEGFQVGNLGLTEAEVNLKVVYYNPNDFGVRVKEAVVNVMMDSIMVGQFNQVEEVTTGSKAEFGIPLNAKVPIGTILQSRLPRLVGKEVTVEANGTVKVGKAGVFVTRQVNYKSRQRLDLDALKNPAKAGLIQ